MRDTDLNHTDSLLTDCSYTGILMMCDTGVFVRGFTDSLLTDCSYTGILMMCDTGVCDTVVCFTGISDTDLNQDPYGSESGSVRIS